jgi:hypothetical protein
MVATRGITKARAVIPLVTWAGQRDVNEIFQLASTDLAGTEPLSAL